MHVHASWKQLALSAVSKPVEIHCCDQLAVRRGIEPKLFTHSRLTERELGGKETGLGVEAGLSKRDHVQLRVGGGRILLGNTMNATSSL